MFNGNLGGGLWITFIGWFLDHAASAQIGQVMLPLDQLQRTTPGTGLWAALQLMDRDGVNQLPVTQDGHVTGMLRREDVITFLRTLQELGV